MDGVSFISTFFTVYLEAAEKFDVRFNIVDVRHDLCASGDANPLQIDRAP
jgi:hypothetical protein